MSQIDMVVSQLKEFFKSDVIQEGDKLPNEKELCETLCVGRSTLRESIRALEVMGYVKIYPGRGAFLAQKKLDNATSSVIQWLSDNKPRVNDVVEIRMALENLAVKLAVERASEEQLAHIDACRVAFEKALEAQKYDDLGQYDAAFHQSIVEATGNDLLNVISRIVMFAFADFREHSFRLSEHAANAIMPHREIASAIENRDVELAQLQMSRHLQKILVDMNASLSGTGGNQFL
ncbi:MAG: FadR/GntR family transcriptional regulator [Clostridia bacterium]